MRTTRHDEGDPGGLGPGDRGGGVCREERHPDRRHQWGGSMAGAVAISGSSTVLPISQLVAENFSTANPDAQISVDGPGTGDGFILFCEGKTDISDASRQIEPEEAKACKKAGINYVELEIGLDGITVMTNPANSSITCLNDGDLYALFGPESQGLHVVGRCERARSGGRRNGELPRRAAHHRGARPGVRHLRLVHRTRRHRRHRPRTRRAGGQGRGACVPTISRAATTP